MKAFLIQRLFMALAYETFEARRFERGRFKMPRRSGDDLFAKDQEAASENFRYRL